MSDGEKNAAVQKQDTFQMHGGERHCVSRSELVAGVAFLAKFLPGINRKSLPPVSQLTTSQRTLTSSPSALDRRLLVQPRLLCTLRN